jgi:hypothetical protein
MGLAANHTARQDRTHGRRGVGDPRRGGGRGAGEAMSDDTPSARPAASAGGGLPVRLDYDPTATTIVRDSHGLRLVVPMNARARRAYVTYFIINVASLLFCLPMVGLIPRDDRPVSSHQFRGVSVGLSGVGVVLAAVATACVWAASGRLRTGSISIDSATVQLTGMWSGRIWQCGRDKILRVSVQRYGFTRFGELRVLGIPFLFKQVGIAERSVLEELASQIRAELGLPAPVSPTPRRWWPK